MKILRYFGALFIIIISHNTKASQIKAVNKSSHKEIIIIINQGAPQIKDSFVTDTLRAQLIKKDPPKEAPKEGPAPEPGAEPAKEPAKEEAPEPVLLRNFIKKEERLPEATYEKLSTQIMPSKLWNATVYQGNQIFVANLQEHPALRALDDKVDITIEVSDDGQLKFLLSCPCPPAVDVSAKKEIKK